MTTGHFYTWRSREKLSRATHEILVNRLLHIARLRSALTDARSSRLKHITFAVASLSALSEIHPRATRSTTHLPNNSLLLSRPISPPIPFTTSLYPHQPPTTMTGSRWKPYELDAIRDLYNQRMLHLRTWKKTNFPAPTTWTWSVIAEKMTEMSKERKWPYKRNYTPGNCDGVVRTNYLLFPGPDEGAVAGFVRSTSGLAATLTSGSAPASASTLGMGVGGQMVVGELTGQMEYVGEVEPTGQIEYIEEEEPVPGGGQTVTEYIASSEVSISGSGQTVSSYPQAPQPTFASSRPSPSPSSSSTSSRHTGPPPVHWPTKEKIALKTVYIAHKADLGHGNDYSVWKKVAKKMRRDSVTARWGVGRKYDKESVKRQVQYHRKWFDAPADAPPPPVRAPRAVLPVVVVVVVGQNGV